MKNLKAKLEININEVLADIYDADNKRKEFAEKYANLKKIITQYMDSKGINEIHINKEGFEGYVQRTITYPTNFNNKKFKEDHKSLYEEYSSKGKRVSLLTDNLKEIN